MDVPFPAVRGPLARGVPSSRRGNGRIEFEARRRVSAGQQQRRRRRRRGGTRRREGQEAKVERGGGPACLRTGAAFDGSGSFEGESWGRCDCFVSRSGFRDGSHPFKLELKVVVVSAAPVCAPSTQGGIEKATSSVNQSRTMAFLGSRKNSCTPTPVRLSAVRCRRPGVVGRFAPNRFQGSERRSGNKRGRGRGEHAIFRHCGWNGT